MAYPIRILGYVEFDLTAFNEVHDEHGRFGESTGGDKDKGSDKGTGIQQNNTGEKEGGKKEAKKRDTRVTIQKRETGPKDEAKSERAKATYSAERSGKDVQDYAEKAEKDIVSRIGGVQGSNNGAVDVVRRVGGVEHGIELKTFVSKGGPNKSGMKAQLKMEPEQKERKETWKAGKENRQSGVLVLDHRDKATTPDGKFIGNKEAYSGHEIYYRRDYGAHTLGGMYKATSAADVQFVMSKSNNELRAMMKADPKKYNGIIGKNYTG